MKYPNLTRCKLITRKTSNHVTTCKHRFRAKENASTGECQSSTITMSQSFMASYERMPERIWHFKGRQAPTWDNRWRHTSWVPEWASD